MSLSSTWSKRCTAACRALEAAAADTGKVEANLATVKPAEKLRLHWRADLIRGLLARRAIEPALNNRGLNSVAGSLASAVAAWSARITVV